MSIRWTVGAVCIALLCEVGCATVRVGGGVSLEETKALFTSAKYSGAIVKSPYEYYAAEIYLNQATQEFEKGNAGAADQYLAKAHEFATAAYQNAKKFRKIDLK